MKKTKTTEAEAKAACNQLTKLDVKRCRYNKGKGTPTMGIKYNLHKNGSPLTIGFHSIEQLEEYKNILKILGYNPIKVNYKANL